MRRVFTACIFFLLTSCLSETGVKPGNGDTFIRYYNGGNNDQAVAMEETPDKGFIILATTTIKKAEADIPNYKVKLIKTDNFGNPVWTKLFPDISVKDINYTASSLQILPTGGYVITGDDIQVDVAGNVLSSKVLVMTVDESGNQLKNVSLPSPVDLNTGQPIVVTSGKAVAVNTPGNFLVLSVSGTDAMYLAEINKDSFTPTWTIPYSAGETSLSSRLFIDEVGKILWSGVATKNGLTGIRMIKTAPNSKLTDFDLLISEPGFSEEATDFCRFGYGYAITGSTNKKAGSATPSTDTDILFRRFAPDGTILSSQSFAFDNQNDVGNSISSTQDGGLVILSSVLSTAIGGRGDTDYYLIKLNAFGETVWTSSFGSRYKDDGTTVRQTTDGGFAVLGTTTQGGVKLITLTKTDKNGKVQ